LRKLHRLRVALEVGDAVRAPGQVPIEDRSLVRAEFAGEVIREELAQLPARQLPRANCHEAAPARACSTGGASARAPSRLTWGSATTHAKSFAKKRSSVQSRATRTFFSRRGSLLR